MPHEEHEEDHFERRRESHVRDELVRRDAPTESPHAACFGGEDAEFADRPDEEAGVDEEGDRVVGEGGGEGGRGAKTDGAGGDGANDMAEAFYFLLALLIWLMAALAE